MHIIDNHDLRRYENALYPLSSNITCLQQVINRNSGLMQRSVDNVRKIWVYELSEAITNALMAFSCDYKNRVFVDNNVRNILL